MREKCTYGNMAMSELLCVRVVTLLRNIYASVLRLCHKACMLELPGLFFTVLDIFLALNTAQEKKKDIARAIILVWAS